MSDSKRFQVRDTEEELNRLDQAILALGYKDRADWYRDMKRMALKSARILIIDSPREKGNGVMLFVQDEEPKDPKEGDIWVDTSSIDYKRPE